MYFKPTSFLYVSLSKIYTASFGLDEKNDDKYMKTKSAALLLAFFFGGIGIHWFYLGRNTRGVIYLCIGGGLGLFYMFPLILTCILALFDFLIIAFKSQDDFDAEYNKSYIQHYNLQKQQHPQNDFSSKADKLKELKILLDSGVLTQEEFDSEKKIILNS